MQHHSQFTFSFLGPRKKVSACFDGGEITTDAGLLPLKEFEHKIRYLERINRAIIDPRQAAKVIHEQHTLLAQRLFGIVAGYEDCNDHQRLRHDPTFKVLAEPTDLAAPLSGQSTLCRLENRITSQDLGRLRKLLIDTFLETHPKPPRSVTLDLDTTADPCHGTQQLCLFNAHYGNYIYLPLLIFEAHSGHLLAADLRLGQKPSGEEVVFELERVVTRLRQARRGLRIRVRGDAEFAAPDLYEYLEAESIPYALGIAGYKTFQKRAQKLVRRARVRFRQTKQAQKLFGQFRYRARSWDKRRRIVFKVEVSSQGTNLRFVITSLSSKPHRVFAFYEQRGECENRIKEVKNGFTADRLSCHDFVANAFRLLIHALAYNLHNLFRRAVSPLLNNAQIDTTRWQLFKIGAYVKRSTRRLCFHLSSSWPFASRFVQICQAVAALPVLHST